MSETTSILVEACVDSLQGALVAQSAGANRLELNFALELDGITPSAGLVNQVLEQANLPVIAMVRPRSGDFCYSDLEWQTMMADAKLLLDTGVHVLAFGARKSDRTVDVNRCEAMRDLARDRELVFHKAFDEIEDWTEAGSQLIELGIDRVMTSGRMASSADGIPAIRQLQSDFEGRLVVLPAGGVNASNAVQIVEQGGVSQLHGTFSRGNPTDFQGISDEIQSAISALATRFHHP